MKYDISIFIFRFIVIRIYATNIDVKQKNTERFTIQIKKGKATLTLFQILTLYENRKVLK